MSTNLNREPGDEQITNDDHSVTNHDADDASLEKGAQPTEQNKPDDQRVPTVTPDNDNGDPGPPVEKEDEDSSNVGNGPSVENL